MVSVLSLLLPVLALISLLRSEFQDKALKVVWVLMILLVPLIGPLLYFIIGRRQRIPMN
ncbi:MAG: PLD nuclease N-terminal domain-containing protein [Candidatus Dadabacteria bacterium]